MRRRSVAMVLRDGVHAVDVSGPLDVFSAANRGLQVEERYEIVLLAKEPCAVRTSNGMSILPDRTFADAAAVFDVVLVPGGPSSEDVVPDVMVEGWLREWGRRTPNFAFVSEVAFAPGPARAHGGAAAGDRPPTGAGFAASLSDVPVIRDHVLVRRDRQLVWSGVSGAVDLVLAIVAEDHGAILASWCSRHVASIVFPRSEPETSARSGGDLDRRETLLHRVLIHIGDHLDQPLPVERLASVAGTSTRSLARLFGKVLGMTPHELVERWRLELARRLIVDTDERLKVLAHRCGFGGAEQMRVVFQRRLGVSPAAYRNSRRGARDAQSNQDVITSWSLSGQRPHAAAQSNMMTDKASRHHLALRRAVRSSTPPCFTF